MKILFSLIIAMSFLVGSSCNNLPSKATDENSTRTNNTPSFLPVDIHLDSFVKEKGEHYKGELSKLIREQKSVLIPKHLYHTGKATNLIQNSPNISQANWDKYIMGDGSRYSKDDLWARGYYGSIYLEGNIYADPDDPGFARITIKDDCRQPNEVYSLIDLFLDQRFITWFEASDKTLFNSLESYKNSCYKESDHGFFNFSKNSADCGTLLENFLTQNNIKSLYDDKYPQIPSFYFQKKECIEKIESTPEEIVSLVNNDPIVKNAAAKSDVGGGHVAEILFGIYFDNPGLIKLAMVEELYQMDKDPKWEKFLNAYKRCQKNGIERRLVERIPKDGALPAKDSPIPAKENFIQKDFDRVCHKKTL